MDSGLWEVSIGYRLVRSAWGKGFATEAVAALLQAAFARESITRVIANTYEENLSSQRVLDKLGMKLCRRYRPTSEDLSSSDTSRSSPGEPWDGDELEYELDREVFLALFS